MSTVIEMANVVSFQQFGSSKLQYSETLKLRGLKKERRTSCYT